MQAPRKRACESSLGEQPVITTPQIARRISRPALPSISPTHSLSTRAMLVSLHLNAWGGQRVDKKVTAEVLKERNAQSDAGRFEKMLVPKEALDPITTVHNRARTRHKKLTLPWGEESRILAAPAFLDYTKEMAEERRACEAAYRAFLAEYPALVASAPKRLGADMYNASEFPSERELAMKFGFRTSITPLTDSGDDFRVALGEDLEAAIRAEIDRNVRTQYSDAQLTLWTRVLDTAKHFAQAMDNPDKTFQYTTVSNLVEIAELAPKLSLTDDPRLNAICDEILSIAGRADAKGFRRNPQLRSEAAADTKAALARIEEAMQGAF
jgi:hypothetical protein